MRAAANDFMQSFRFHVIANNKNGINPLQLVREDIDDGGNAGFQSVTIPEISVEAVEYREGIFKWTQKYSGPPTVSDCTLMRGVIKNDSTFFDWVMDSVDGNEYRSEVIIYHYQRAEMGQVKATPAADTYRHIKCINCIPTRVKPNGDLDATSGEVSMGEVDFAMESFELIK